MHNSEKLQHDPHKQEALLKKRSLRITTVSHLERLHAAAGHQTTLPHHLALFINESRENAAGLRKERDKLCKELKETKETRKAIAKDRLVMFNELEALRKRQADDGVEQV